MPKIRWCGYTSGGTSTEIAPRTFPQWCFAGHLKKKKKMKSHLIWPAADPHGGLMQSEHPAELNTMKQLTFSFSYRQGHALKRLWHWACKSETWQSCDLRISLQEIWIWWWVIRYKMAKGRMKGVQVQDCEVGRALATAVHLQVLRWIPS